MTAPNPNPPTPQPQQIVVQAPASSAAPEPRRPPKVAALIARYGTPDAALAQLATENFNHRRKKQELETQVTNLQNQIKDAVILTGDDKKLWEAVKGAGLKPEELSTKLKEHADLTKEKANRDVAEKVTPVAREHGFNSAAVIAHALDKGLVLSVKDRAGAREGEPKQEIMVREPGEGKTDKPLKDYVDGLPSYHKVALTSKEETGTQGGPPNRSTGQPFVRQPAGGSSSSTGTQGGSNNADPLAGVYMTPGERERQNQK
jgi:hypothetical protein